MKQSLSRASRERRLPLIAALLLATSMNACIKQSQNPASQESGPAATSSTARASTNKLNINVASADEIEKLPGVGKIMAERIVTHRRQFGPFRRVEHLLMVQGLSDLKFRELRDLISVE
jgi:competence protein ComEA